MKGIKNQLGETHDFESLFVQHINNLEEERNSLASERTMNVNVSSIQESKSKEAKRRNAQTHVLEPEVNESSKVKADTVQKCGVRATENSKGNDENETNLQKSFSDRNVELLEKGSREVSDAEIHVEEVAATCDPYTAKLIQIFNNFWANSMKQCSFPIASRTAYIKICRLFKHTADQNTYEKAYEQLFMYINEMRLKVGKILYNFFKVLCKIQFLNQNTPDETKGHFIDFWKQMHKEVLEKFYLVAHECKDIITFNCWTIQPISPKNSKNQYCSVRFNYDDKIKFIEPGFGTKSFSEYSELRTVYRENELLIDASQESPVEKLTSLIRSIYRDQSTVPDTHFLALTEIATVLDITFVRIEKIEEVIEWMTHQLVVV